MTSLHFSKKPGKIFTEMKKKIDDANHCITDVEGISDDKISQIRPAGKPVRGD